MAPRRENHLPYTVDSRKFGDLTTLICALVEDGFALNFKEDIMTKSSSWIPITFESGHHGKAAMNVLHNFQPAPDIKFWARGSPEQLRDNIDPHNARNAVPTADRITEVMRRVYARNLYRTTDLERADQECEEGRAARRQAQRLEGKANDEEEDSDLKHKVKTEG